jgi:hypothetical protein
VAIVSPVGCGSRSRPTSKVGRKVATFGRWPRDLTAANIGTPIFVSADGLQTDTYMQRRLVGTASAPRRGSMIRRSVALLVTVSAIVAMVARPALATHYTTVEGTPGNDRIVAGPQPQEIHGKAGDDFLVGGKSPDIVRGGPGDDRIWTGKGGVPDQAYGGPGDDRLHNVGSGQAGQIIDGGPGYDICAGDKFDTFIGCEVVKFG